MRALSGRYPRRWSSLSWPSQPIGTCDPTLDVAVLWRDRASPWRFPADVLSPMRGRRAPGQGSFWQRISPPNKDHSMSVTKASAGQSADLFTVPLEQLDPEFFRAIRNELSR